MPLETTYVVPSMSRATQENALSLKHTDINHERPVERIVRWVQ